MGRGRKTTSNTGRKATTSGNAGASAPRSAVYISEAAMATYKLVQAQLEAKKKASQEADDAGTYFSDMQ